MLTSQLLVNVAVYYHWMIDDHTELTELCCCEEDASEEKSDKKEKSEKFYQDLYFPKIKMAKSIMTISHIKNAPPLYHPEINTPPPECILS